MRKIITTLALLLIAQSVGAEDYIDLVKKGNQAFKANENKKALELYRAAETQIPESPELNYNFGGALHQEGNYEESIERFQRSMSTIDPLVESSAHYNLANTYFRMEDYQKAITSYQDALNLNPDDMDAKFNLELARKMLKEQIQPQQQENKQKQQQQQQDQQEKQDQENQDEQKDQQQQDQQQEEQQDQQQQPQQQDKKMSKEDAERILNALKDDEQDIQKKVQRQTTSSGYSGKDW